MIIKHCRSGAESKFIATHLYRPLYYGQRSHTKKFEKKHRVNLVAFASHLPQNVVSLRDKRQVNLTVFYNCSLRHVAMSCDICHTCQAAISAFHIQSRKQHSSHCMVATEFNPNTQDGAASDPNNYRLFSLNSILCKLMQSIIKDNIPSRQGSS